MSSCTECESRKRLRREEEDDETDRLSYLPHSVLYHILSFLDTKEAVQTSVLSRVWRCVWKHVPVIVMDSGCFRTKSSFMRFVGKVLSLRYDVEACKISYSDYTLKWNQRHTNMLSGVISYALSHATQHLVIALGIEGTFSDLFDSMPNCSFKALELESVTFDSSLDSYLAYSIFHQLSTLTLRRCLFRPGQEELFDPISKFPCLENLVMEYCCSKQGCTAVHECLRISGLRLLALKIVLNPFCKFEIHAPKLESFTCEHVGQCLELLDLNLPSLRDADILVTDRAICYETNLELAAQKMVNFFQSFHSVKSLKLRSDTIQALSKISGFLEQQPSSFKRLENLYVEAEDIPHNITSYFLKGSLVQHQVSLI